MSLTIADIKKLDTQSVRDVAAGLEAKAAHMGEVKGGIANLPHVGNWTGVAASSANDATGAFGNYLGANADSYQGAAKKIRSTADQFDGVKQLLGKVEDAARGKFAIDETSGAVTALTKHPDPSEQQYIASTLKQIMAAGNELDGELAAAIHSTDGPGAPAATSPAAADPAHPKPGDQPGGADRLKDTLFNGVGGDPKATKPADAPAPGALSDTVDRLHHPDAQSGTPQPGQAPAKPDPAAGSLQTTLGQLGKPNPNDPRVTPAPLLNPNTPEGKAAIDQVRGYLQSKGLPPAQVEQQLNDAIAKAQQPHAMYSAPDPAPEQPHKEKFSDAFHDSWDQGIHGIQDLFGAGDKGAAGIPGAWENMAEGTAHQLTHPWEQPLHDAKDLINNPQGFLGHKTAELAQTAPGLIFGGESAAVRAGLPADLVTEGGAPAALMRDWNPTGGIPWDEFQSRFGTPESRLWPGNDGFPPGYVPQPAHLPEGTIIDRFGSEHGRYLAPDGTPFADRALAPESIGGAYNRYMVTGQPLPEGWRILEGPLEPFYGQTPPPGSLQYMIEAPNGVRPTVWELVRLGILDEYGPPLGR